MRYNITILVLIFIAFCDAGITPDQELHSDKNAENYKGVVRQKRSLWTKFFEHITNAANAFHPQPLLVEGLNNENNFGIMLKKKSPDIPHESANEGISGSASKKLKAGVINTGAKSGRKKKINVKASAKDNNDEMTEKKENTVTMSATAESITPYKRKRGRPRKKTTMTEKQKKTTKSNVKKIYKKRRGRPLKKAKTNEKSTEMTGKSENIDAKKTSTAKLSAKKKRGRKKKINAKTSAKEKSAAKIRTKKKRGRKKKSDTKASAKDNSDEMSEKKENAVTMSATVESMTQYKRKRGRPRKKATTNEKSTAKLSAEKKRGRKKKRGIKKKNNAETSTETNSDATTDKKENNDIQTSTIEESTAKKIRDTEKDAKEERYAKAREKIKAKKNREAEKIASTTEDMFPLEDPVTEMLTNIEHDAYNLILENRMLIDEEMNLLDFMHGLDIKWESPLKLYVLRKGTNDPYANYYISRCITIHPSLRKKAHDALLNIRLSRVNMKKKVNDILYLLKQKTKQIPKKFADMIQNKMMEIFEYNEKWLSFKSDIYYKKKDHGVYVDSYLKY